MKISITGASSDIGSALVDRLANSPSITSVEALGRKPPKRLPPGIGFRRWEFGQHLPYHDKGEMPDVLIHCAFLVEEPRDKNIAYSSNVAGSALIFEDAVRLGIPHICFISSANAYGFRSGSLPLKEDDEIAPSVRNFYLHHKYQCEKILNLISEVQDRTKVSIVRPCMVIGENYSNSALNTLRKKVIFYPKPQISSYQFITSDDLCKAIEIIISKRLHGTFNIAPNDSLTVHDIAAELGANVFPVPYRIACFGADILFRLRLLPYSSHWVTLGDPVMSSLQTQASLRWSPTYSSRDVLTQFFKIMSTNT